MSRINVPPAQSDNLSDQITSVRYLVELQYSIVLRFASGWPQPTNYGGFDWVPGGVGEVTYTQNHIGQQSARIEVPHSSQILGVDENEALFRIEGFEGQPASLWKHDPATNEVTPLLINGFVDDGRIGDLSTQIEVVGRISDRIRIPRATFGAPAFAQNTPSPARVTWQGEVIRLESE